MLYPIYGKPLIEHVVQKIKKSKKIDLIVSTSKNKNDDKLVKFLKKKNIKFYRGPLKNVAKRLYDTAKKEEQDYFVRVSGDSPLIDYKLLDKIINVFNKNKNYDLITNLFPRTFPSGQSIEIIKTKSLGKNLKYFSVKDKEHVTNFFYKNNSRFKIKNIINTKYYDNFKLSVDTKMDLTKILKKLNKKKFLNYSYSYENN